MLLVLHALQWNLGSDNGRGQRGPGPILQDMLITRTCLGTDMVAVSQDSGPIDSRGIDVWKPLSLQTEIILAVFLCTKNLRMISTQLINH